MRKPSSRICSKCDKPMVARGLCRYHYRSAGFDKSYNKPLLRSGICNACGVEFTRMGTSTKRMNSCSQACASILAGRASAARRVHFPSCKVYINQCSECATLFASPTARVCCSVECQAARSGYRNKPCPECGVIVPGMSLNTYCYPCLQRHAKESRRVSRHVRRARMKAVAYERIKPTNVYERDEWMCGICHGAVDSSLAYPHPYSASLDHVVPLAHRGTHMMDNVQLAHLTCNHDKGATMPAVISQPA